MCVFFYVYFGDLLAAKILIPRPPNVEDQFSTTYFQLFYFLIFCQFALSGVGVRIKIPDPANNSCSDPDQQRITYWLLEGEKLFFPLPFNSSFSHFPIIYSVPQNKPFNSSFLTCTVSLIICFLSQYQPLYANTMNCIAFDKINFFLPIF